MVGKERKKVKFFAEYIWQNTRQTIGRNFFWTHFDSFRVFSMRGRRICHAFAMCLTGDTRQRVSTLTAPSRWARNGHVFSVLCRDCCLPMCVFSSLYCVFIFYVCYHHNWPSSRALPCVLGEALMRHGVDGNSPSSWEPQEEGMMSTAGSFPSVRNQDLSNPGKSQT
jgi:hypothetical protein